MILYRSLSLFFLGTVLLTEASTQGVKGARGATRRQLKKQKIRGPNERECDISAKSEKVKVECKSKTGGSMDSRSSDGVEATDRGITVIPDLEIKDKIKYEVKTTDEGIRVKLEYKNEVEMDDTETETKTKFELMFSELVEYVKAADAESEAYDWDQDGIVQSLPLTEWSDISAVVDSTDGVLSYFTVTTTSMGAGAGSAAFNFTISRADQGESITANSMKIDVRILDFPWSRNNSYVALMSTLEAKKKVKVEYDNEATVSEGGKKAKKAKDVVISFGDEDVESTFGFSTYGEYTWAQEAEATIVGGGDFNGTVLMGRQSTAESSTIDIPEALLEEPVSSTIEVIATSPTTLGNETYQSIAYSFVGAAAQGASDIYWDPEAGVGYESSGRMGLSAVMGLAGSLLVSLFYLV